MGVKAEILIANPEATQKEEFLRWAEFEATLPLPQYVLANIVASWNTRTYRKTLEMQIAAKHTTMTQAANRLLYLYQTDTVPAPQDSIRWVWQQIRTNGGRYAEAALLLGSGDFIGARSVIESMPAEKNLKTGEEAERQRMLTNITVLETATVAGRHAYSLTPQEVETLQTMASNTYDRPSNWANNLLCAVYGKCKAPWTGGGIGPKSLVYTAAELEATAGASAIQLYPNPASTYTALDFQIGTSSSSAYATLTDPTGRVMQTEQLQGTTGQVVLDTRSLAKGTYMVALYLDGELIDTKRLIVQ